MVRALLSHTSAPCPKHRHRAATDSAQVPHAINLPHRSGCSHPSGAAREYRGSGALQLYIIGMPPTRRGLYPRYTSIACSQPAHTFARSQLVRRHWAALPTARGLHTNGAGRSVGRARSTMIIHQREISETVRCRPRHRRPRHRPLMPRRTQIRARRARLATPLLPTPRPFSHCRVGGHHRPTPPRQRTIAPAPREPTRRSRL